VSSRSNESVGIDNANKLARTHTGPADARTVSAFRRGFGEWLNHHLELDDERAADIVLATDEALANCADHAYRVVDHAGSMTLQIAYHPITTELRVCVSDRGHWVEPNPEARNAECGRGRGIVLMRAVADACTIDGRDDGTTVCLRFYDCPPKNYILSRAC
jgi:serine/threonine-protein kinase RsbW